MVEVLKPSYDGEQAIKGGGGEAISMGEADPLVTIGLSSYYYIFKTIKGTLMQI